MQITTLGIIQALKNIALFLGTWLIADIQTDPIRFIYAFIIYILLTVPSDLYLLNKAHEGAKELRTDES